eukprot:scaffold15994_cov33-Phaeocystis_antarctica.AAC.3
MRVEHPLAVRVLNLRQDGADVHSRRPHPRVDLARDTVGRCEQVGDFVNREAARLAVAMHPDLHARL